MTLPSDRARAVLALLAAVIAAPAHAQSERGYALRFEPPAREALAMTSVEAHDLLMTALLVRIGDGEPVPQDLRVQLRTRAEATLADEWEPAAGRIRRRFVDVAGRMRLVDPASVDEESGEGSGQEVALSSPCVGVSVAFQPAEGQPDGYGRHYDGKALREPLLPRLAVPFDWSEVLPPAAAGSASGAVSLGAKWALPPEAMEPLLAPTGFLPWRGGKKADPQMLRAHAFGVGGNLQIGFDGQVSGKAEARLTEVGGDPVTGRYAVITYTFAIDLEADRSDFVAERRLERERNYTARGARLRARLEGECTLRWGLDVDLPIAVDLRADETVEMTVRVQPEAGEEMEQTMRMEGLLLNTLRFRTIPRSPSRRAEGR